ncbi:ABC-type Fe3+ transport system, periplasmic component [Halapricum desulfuricans]|uniref:ABC-type Fe3+ transport system, periplasmic component n=2 Tax=Halapricum desulfuricans TaxID=2841257 RepID=A0A897NH04_9EURY|nr:ABC-type Fe3+ transport system, periplasmic component [Halapricum desulfuricans]
MMTNDDSTFGDRSERPGTRSSRRGFLATSGVAAAGALAGCTGLLGGDSGDYGAPDYDAADAAMEAMALSEFQGSGAILEGRPAPGGRSMEDLPNLSGELSIYLGGGEGGLYLQLFDVLEEVYPDFSYTSQSKPSSELALQIADEAQAGQLQADLFISIGAGSLGTVLEDGATRPLTEETVDPVPDAFVQPDRNWVGIAGRARAVPYNTEQLDEGDLPDSVMDFPDADPLQSATGWAPTYGAFQDFITAMRLQEGEDATRQWLEDMQAAGIQSYDNEFLISDAVSTGELAAGFANHYYALRVLNGSPDRPLDLHFTRGDAGSLVNVSGAALLDRDENAGLADVFVRHLLSAEAQEFFATRTYAYPMLPGVQPVGDLPTIDELETPDIDLTELANTGPTTDLLTEAGVL